MTDRDRFTLHILPGMPATREGAMRPRINVTRAAHECRQEYERVKNEWFRKMLDAVVLGQPVNTVYWNAETYGWQTTPPKRKKRKERR